MMNPIPPELPNRSNEVLESEPVAPFHYALTVKGNKVEVKDIINAFNIKLIDHGSDMELHENLYEWDNIIKYVLRAPFKGATKSDLSKAKYCLELILANIEKNNDD
jgi:hypothetical protein